MRHGHYAVEEIFKPDGIYGRWGWRGILAYLVGFGRMVPFFCTPSFTGPIAKAMDGADFSLFVGLPVAGGPLLLLRALDRRRRGAGGSPSARPTSSRRWRASTRCRTARA